MAREQPITICLVSGTDPEAASVDTRCLKAAASDPKSVVPPPVNEWLLLPKSAIPESSSGLAEVHSFSAVQSIGALPKPAVKFDREKIWEALRQINPTMTTMARFTNILDPALKLLPK